jgi:uncharacterized membrane protein YbaN (DUF454 family)
MPLKQLLWRALGLISTGIGLVNAFLPVLPTTVFLIVGAWAFGKGAPEWRAKLLQHPRFGKALRDWDDGGRVSRRGKILASIGILISWSLSVFFFGFKTLTGVVGIGLAGLALWLVTRPLPRE